MVQYVTGVNTEAFFIHLNPRQVISPPRQVAVGTLWVFCCFFCFDINTL